MTDLNPNPALITDAVLAEFPDYDVATLPALPAGFEDYSWHNDVCPHFFYRAKRIDLWCDYADKAQREFRSAKRFRLYATEPNDVGERLLDEPIISTDDWNEVLRFIGPDSDPLAALSDEFSLYCWAHELSDQGDALELLMGDLTREQRLWLEHFVERWDAAEATRR